METDRCPVCGAAGRERSPAGRAACARCHADLPRHCPVWVIPLAFALAIAGLVLYSLLGT